MFSKESYIRKGQIGELINLFITKVEVDEVENSFSEPLLKYNAVHKHSEKSLLSHLQKLVREQVIFNSNVQQLEIKGQKIVAELFEVFATDPERLLPESVKKQYIESEKSNEGNRVICDFIAGMTDSYATKLYEKIFTPRKGSIFEVL